MLHNPDFRNSPVEFTGNINVVHEAFNVEWYVGGVCTHQLFELLTLLVKSHQSPRFCLDIQFVLLCKLLTEVVDQNIIKIFAAQF